MSVDPQIAAMLAAMPEWPGVRNVPLAMLRQSVRDSSMALPPAADTAVARVEDRSFDGPAGRIGLRLYWPEGDGPFPITLFMHGGGYVVGDLDTQDMIARALCAWARTLVVSVDYRLAPEHPFPAGPEDSYAALRWVAEQASELKGDSARIAVAGDSAGGNHASALALMARDRGGPGLCGVVNIYGSCNFPSEDTPSSREFADGPILRTDDVDWFWEQYLADSADRDDYRASPFRAVSHVGLPPHFVGTAECDPSRDDAEAYAAKLSGAGVPVAVRRYAGMVHGFASWVGFLPGARAILGDAAEFLKTQFGH
jgi:acetyl esterase